MKSTKPMQRHHLDEETEVFLVYGWETSVKFSSGAVGARLDELETALAGTEDVFVVAQDLCYCDGTMATVIGRAALRVHANDGPVELPLAKVREIETSEPLSADARKKLAPLLDKPIAGAPKWFVVPSGSLATAYFAFGTLSPRKGAKAPAGTELIYGGNKNQEGHETAVVGAWVCNASDWRIEAVDLAAETDAERRSRQPEGRYYLMGRYD
jgi:hypothetical protein